MQYFPKNEKYVPLFCGSDDQEIVDKRNGLRKQIEERLSAAAASGKDLEGSYYQYFFLLENVSCRCFMLVARI